MIRPPPRSPLFPYAPLVQSRWTPRLAARWTSTFRRTVGDRRASRTAARLLRSPYWTRGVIGLLERFPSLSQPVVRRLDRKSTRLNSSHLVISYAVFCLTKLRREPQTQPWISGDSSLQTRGRLAIQTKNII